MKQADLQQFRTPGIEFRGAPFWAWNSKLEIPELLRQLRHLKRMGFGGFFMHARVGLDTEYLGDEWFECIRACVAEAEKLGMNAWLYDEDRWPSGAASGKVTKDDRYKMKGLYCEPAANLRKVHLPGLRRQPIRKPGRFQVSAGFPNRSEANLPPGNSCSVFTGKTMNGRRGSTGKRIWTPSMKRLSANLLKLRMNSISGRPESSSAGRFRAFSRMNPAIRISPMTLCRGACAFRKSSGKNTDMTCWIICRNCFTIPAKKSAMPAGRITI